MSVELLKQACPGATAEFLMEAVENGETPESASKRWVTQLLAERDELRQQVADLTVVSYLVPGIEPLGVAHVRY
jgi:hypothetical protein